MNSGVDDDLFILGARQNENIRVTEQTRRYLTVLGVASCVGRAV